jgi:hypothetical protein
MIFHLRQKGVMFREGISASTGSDVLEQRPGYNVARVVKLNFMA